MAPSRRLCSPLSSLFYFVFLSILLIDITCSLPLKLKCGDVLIPGGLDSQPTVAPTETEYKPWTGITICTDDPSEASYVKFEELELHHCQNRSFSARHLIVSKTTSKIPGSLWYQYDGNDRIIDGPCILAEDNPQEGPSSTDALRSFSKTSVLFVSISFIILMVISLAWLVFYYVQRFRYAHAKDRLQRRLFNAARKALARIPTRPLRTGDVELDTDCAVCIDPYQAGDVVRTLPCRHVYHKSCIDPWLLEHRTCPMCKADILKYFGYQVTAGDASRVEDRDVRDAESPEPPSSGSDSAGFPFPSTHEHDSFHFTPATSPQLVMSSASAKSFSIVPLTVHPKPQTAQSNEEAGPSHNNTNNNSNNNRNERASSAGVAEARTAPVRAGSQGQIVNLVQVRSRAQSCTRAVTIRKPDRPMQPTPIEGPGNEPI